MHGTEILYIFCVLGSKLENYFLHTIYAYKKLQCRFLKHYKAGRKPKIETVLFSFRIRRPLIVS